MSGTRRGRELRSMQDGSSIVKHFSASAPTMSNRQIYQPTRKGLIESTRDSKISRDFPASSFKNGDNYRTSTNLKLVGIDSRWNKHDKSVPQGRPIIYSNGSGYRPKRSQLSNESLEKYVVLRQKSFHGLQRSKQELKKLPQSDPRDDSSSPDTWVHKSRTDLYIEKRLYKKKQKNPLDLNGITLRFIVDRLPEYLPDVSKKNVRVASQPISGVKSVSSSRPEKLVTGEETADKFPPLKQREIQAESDGTKISITQCDNRQHCLESQKKGVVRAVPLTIWQPRLDIPPLIANGFSLLQERSKVSPRRYFIETGASVNSLESR